MTVYLCQLVGLGTLLLCSPAAAQDAPSWTTTSGIETSEATQPGNTMYTAAPPTLRRESPPTFRQRGGLRAPSLPDLMRRMVAGILMATGLLLALAWAHRVRISGDRKRTTRPMELLDTLVIGPRCSVHLVRVSDQLIMVGRDAGGMRKIVPLHGDFKDALAKELDAPSADEMLYASTAQDSIDNDTFPWKSHA